jgi:phage gpG-like protein
MFKNPFDEILRKAKRLGNDLPTIVGNEAIVFAKGNFRAQRFQDGGASQTWKERSSKDKNTKQKRAILVQTGRLKQSIRVISKDLNKVVIGSDVPYAKAHNEGETIATTVRVKAHRRQQRQRDTHRTVQGKQGKRSSRVQFVKDTQGFTYVKAHTRKMNLKMPQRQFMGDSPVLRAQIQTEIEKHIKSIFDQF